MLTKYEWIQFFLLYYTASAIEYMDESTKTTIFSVLDVWSNVTNHVHI